jgi:hypothetical protein
MTRTSWQASVDGFYQMIAIAAIQSFSHGSRPKAVSRHPTTLIDGQKTPQSGKNRLS